MNKKDVYNLTNPQKSIWNTEQFLKGTTVNNICTSGIIYENVNVELLKQAISNVVKQNDGFRLHIVLQNDAVKQYVSDFTPFEIDVEYISNEAELKNIEEQQANYKFDIIDSDLFKFKIVVLKGKFACIISTVNHIIADSWSLGISLQESIKNYHSLLENESIDSIKPSYVDYINSENEYKNSSKYEKDKIYWDEIFSTLPEQATVPSLAKNTNKLSYDADRLSFSINSELINKINDYCQANRFSMFNFFMAVYSLYIGRVSNVQDFVIGTPILNRTNFKEKQTAGMFVNTVPVRVSNLADGSFKDLVNSFSQKMREILRHQKYSYNTILEDIRTRTNSVPNLYNVLISYQITKVFDESIGNYKTTWTFNKYCANDININIYDLNDTGSFFVSYDYLTSKYNTKDIQDFHLRIVNIINQVLNNAQILTNQIEIITQEEKNKILYQFNNTTVDYPRNKTIVDLFENQVKKAPDNIAVVFEKNKLTYRELNEKANSLAKYLINKGVTNKDIVCILLNRSLDLIISIYAVIKSGASYVLIDSAFPQNRIDYIINDSKSKYCIANSDSINVDNTINIENFDYSKYDNQDLTIKQSDNLCVIYTSGSTGKPKGVLLHKTGFLNLMYAFDKEMDISKFKNILGIATVSFDMFAVELFSSTLLGNTLILANEEEQKNPASMSKLIKNNNVEFFITTPSRINLLLSKEYNGTLKSVKAFQLGGEEFTEKLYNKLIKYTNAKIFNGYGPTEITACCTNKLVSSGKITIGKPIPGVQAYICDSNLNLLPIGVAGEICIAGLRYF